VLCCAVSSREQSLKSQRSRKGGDKEAHLKKIKSQLEAEEKKQSKKGGKLSKKGSAIGNNINVSGDN
jgi:hypothetical protein